MSGCALFHGSVSRGLPRVALHAHRLDAVVLVGARRGHKHVMLDLALQVYGGGWCEVPMMFINNQEAD